MKIRLVLAALLAQSPAFADTLIHAGHWLDVDGGRMQGAATLRIQGERIVAVTDGFQSAGPGDTLIDLKAATLLPGLMDMHTHLTEETGPRRYTEGFTDNPADFAFRSAVYAERTLLAGFTTVRDLGDIHRVSIALRNAVNQGLVDGPRIYTAGKSIATTGGHADPTNGHAEHLMGNPGPEDGVINGVAEARQAVRQRYKDGSDVIKITGTGGVLSVAKDGRRPQFMDDEVQAIVDTAKDYGMVVAVHAHGAEGMKRAIRAGVDSVEHGTYMDDEAIKLMKQHKTWYVPTISAGKFVGEKAKIPGYYPEIVRPKAAAIGPQIQATFAKAYKAGIKIAFGTDAAVYPHGGNAKEFGYMVEAGMPPLEAIRSATRNAAQLLHIEADAGSIAAGKWADLVAVDSDPLADIHVLESPRFVMKGGKVYKQ
ncbi:MAG: amidohydrolase family protein [Gammaproteobacteria bacterium]|nr:amidohydrolase family protein [Gammaproteobacteria bacterium]